MCRAGWADKAAHQGQGMKKYCFVGYSNHKVVKWREKWISPHLDSEILGRADGDSSCFSFGSPVDGEFFPTKYISNRAGIFKIVRNFFLCGKFSLRDIVFIYKLFKANEYFGIYGPVPRPLWVIWAIRNFVIARHFAYLFRDIAKQHEQARVIVYYSAAMLGVVYAFRKLGKPVYEIQHGYIGPSHNAYNKRELFTSNALFCPTGYVVWDDKTARFLSDLGATDIEIVGFRHLTNFSDRRRSERRVILVTTQWLTPLPAFLDALVQGVDDVVWRFRLHPREEASREDIRHFLQYPNVEMSEPNVALADDLMDSIAHVTPHSSAVHEAAALGVFSFFCSELGQERFHQEVADGRAMFIDEQNAIPALRALLEEKRKGSDDSDEISDGELPIPPTGR